MTLEDVKKEIDLLEKIQSDTGHKARHIGNGKYMLDICPICGHRQHFIIYANTNSYYSFAACCRGGSVVDWEMEFNRLNRNDAVKKLCGTLERISNDIREQREKEKARLVVEKQQINDFYDLICKLFRMFRDAIQEYKKIIRISDILTFNGCYLISNSLTDYQTNCPLLILRAKNL